MSKNKNFFQIEDKKIGEHHPTYFIADIAASHDGELNRAIDLIYLCAEKGADAAKFQHFQAETIVSDFGFKNLGSKMSHQSSWKKSVFDTYADASLPFEWTEKLKKAADEAGIHFFTSPYSLELVDKVDKYVCAYKIGSGDITWHKIIEHMAKKSKPYILATGASSIDDVKNAVEESLKINDNFCLMQCNTNYTASLENFGFINLNVLKQYRDIFPNVVLGLSDHTPGHTTVLGAVSLGARVIEKHFTDDNYRDGPDHLFSMNPKSWEEMVLATRDLELSLGDGKKIVESNEKDTVVVQRRAIRVTRDLESGYIISESDLFPLRPCPVDGIEPYHEKDLIGKKINRAIPKGDIIRWKDLS